MGKQTAQSKNLHPTFSLSMFKWAPTWVSLGPQAVSHDSTEKNGLRPQKVRKEWAINSKVPPHTPKRKKIELLPKVVPVSHNF